MAKAIAGTHCYSGCVVKVTYVVLAADGSVLVYVQIVVGTLISSWFGRGDGDDEGVPVEASVEAPAA